MTFRIRILSPVHIGSGEIYSGLNYIADEDQLWYFEPNALFSSLGSKVNDYVQWLEQSSDGITALEQMMRKAEKQDKNKIRAKLRSARSQFHLNGFCKKSRVDTELIKKAAAYQISATGRIYNADIQKFIAQHHLPYLPGTEIKGAMRTAILYDILQNDSRHFEWLKKKIQDFGDRFENDINMVRNQRMPKKNFLNNKMCQISRQLEQEVFFLANQKDSKYDVLKYLSVSDSDLRKPDDTLSVAFAKPFNTNRSFQAFHEYASPGTVFEFKELNAFEDLHENQQRRINETLGFTDQQKNCVSGVREICRSCYQFSKALLNHEIEFFKTRKKRDIVNHLIQISDQNSQENPVLRIGKGESFLGFTIGLAVKEKAPELYDKVFIHAARGTSYDSSHGGPSPKSRKIVHFNGKEYTAGWMKFMFGENDADPQDY